MIRKALTFDDVTLVPQYNNIQSRTEPDLSTWLTTKTRISIPLLAANMDTVIGYELAEVLLQNGTPPIFHRFTNVKEQLRWGKRFGPRTYMSIGAGVDEKILEKFAKYDVAGLVIDIAHGHSNMMINSIRWIKQNYPNFEIIAGNVCTAGGYIDLVNAGADAVKVGIGPESACTARTVSGFGVPQFTAIQDCSKEAKKYSVPIIADGGIRGSADIVKALAAGATTVMVGKLFALTNESSAEKGQKDHFNLDRHVAVHIAKYRGQTSEDFQTELKGGLKDGTVTEGESFWAPVSGTSQELIDTLIGGIRSGFTYGGARSVGELQRKAEFVEVLQGYHKESNTRED